MIITLRKYGIGLCTNDYKCYPKNHCKTLFIVREYDRRKERKRTTDPEPGQRIL